MSMLLENIIQTRCGGRVERAHNVPHIGGYSNAAHSWGVAMLLWALWPHEFSRLALTALTHDVPEGWTGDMPANAANAIPGLRTELGHIEDMLNLKWGNPAYGNLDSDDARKVKACDKLELYLWCREQLLFGNKWVHDMMLELERMFSRDPLPEPAAALLIEIMGSEIMPRQRGVIRELLGEGD